MFREFCVALMLLGSCNSALAQAQSSAEAASENISEINRKYKEDLDSKLSQTRDVFPKYLYLFAAFAIIMAGAIFLNRRGTGLFSDNTRKSKDDDKTHEPQIDAFWPEPNRHKK